MGKSAKERMRAYRQRLKENMMKYEEHKVKDRERYNDKKKRGVVKMIKDLTPREQRKRRHNWKQNSQDHRDRKRMVTAAVSLALTPPTSPQDRLDVPRPIEQEARRVAMVISHKKRKNKQKSACYRLNEKLKVKLKCQQKLMEKYKKKYYRNRQRHETTEPVDRDLNPKSYHLYKTLIMNVRKWYQRSNSRLEKRMVSNIIVGKRVLKKYGLGAYARSVLGISRRYMYNKDRRIRPAGIKVQMKMKVKTFIERDDNSRITSDKQATITRHGVKMQKRLMNGDLKTLHKKYESENNKMSYSMFCKLRPFWIVKPTEKDRDTCLCKVHENLYYKIDTSYKENMIHTKDINVLMNDIVCNQENKECMYRECDQCRGKNLRCHDTDGKQVVWRMWKNKRIDKEKDGKPKVVNKTVKDQIQGTKETLAEELNAELTRACRHVFNIKHQYKTLKYLHQQISHEEIIMHIDFSENYNTKYASEIQSVHFGASKQQISLHTGVAYIGDNKMSFCTVSDCLKHGPAAIWAHIDPVIKYLKDKYSFSVIHFVSDGPTTQYRNKDNFCLWCSYVFEYGCTSSTWNFLEAAHGKGAADGVGAAVKRAADKQVNTYRKDITCGKDLIACVEEQSSVKMFYVEEQSILNIESHIPSSLKPVKNTMKLHQLTTRKRGEISCRVLSCYCTYPSVCGCFQPVDVQFPVTLPGEATLSGVDNHIPTEPSSPSQILDGDVTVPTIHKQQTPAVSDAKGIVTTELKSVTCVDESLIGKYVVVTYDGIPYPGVILGIDEEDMDIKGRSLFAKKHIQKGDVILDEAPLVSCQFAWNEFYKYTACEYCLRSLESAESMARRLTENPSLVIPHPECCGVRQDQMVTCPQCGMIYCNVECFQNAVEKYHKCLCTGSSKEDSDHPIDKVLDAWRNIHFPPESASIKLLLKMIAMVKQVSDPASLLSDFSQFVQATVNEEEQAIHKLLGQEFQGQLELLRCLVTEAMYDERVQQWLTGDGFRSMFALMGTNQQGIGSSSISVWVKNCEKLQLPAEEKQQLDKYIDQLYEDLDKVSDTFLNCEGVGLYKTQSACNHSCVPNAEIQFLKENHTLSLVALEDIEPEQEICISYLDGCEIERSRHTRQKILKENYLFTCNCSKCLSQADDEDVTSEESEDDDEDEMDDQ